MGKDFIKLYSDHADEIIVNINNITFIRKQNLILVNGNTYEGNGLIHIDKDSAERLSKMMEERLWSGDNE